MVMSVMSVVTAVDVSRSCLAAYNEACREGSASVVIASGVDGAVPTIVAHDGVDRARATATRMMLRVSPLITTPTPTTATVDVAGTRLVRRLTDMRGGGGGRRRTLIWIRV